MLLHVSRMAYVTSKAKTFNNYFGSEWDLWQRQLG